MHTYTYAIDLSELFNTNRTCCDANQLMESKQLRPIKLYCF